MTDPAAQVRLAKMLAARPLAFARRKRRAVCLSCSFGQSACAVSAVCSAKQPGIVLFMFKHCFHYHFPIGFVCGSWVRLRKASLFVGFVWLMRNRGPRPVRRPTGDVSIRRVRLAKTARPSRLFAHTEDCAGSLLAKRSFASPQHQLDKSGCERLGIRRSGAI